MNICRENKHLKIGDIYMMQFNGRGSEQKGWRPGLVFQNNVGNIHSPNIIALPLTSSVKRTNMPTHVLIPSDTTGLKLDSLVLCENPECMSKEKIGNYITTIPDDYMGKIAEAHLLATSAISFINPETLTSIWQRASKLNTPVI